MYAKDKSTIIDRREMLRVKLKALAEEAKIIRREERKTSGPLQEELRRHRTEAVRSETRHTHLAYGFIRGRSLERMEKTSDAPPQWERVRAMLKKYGPKSFEEPECMKEKEKA